MILFKKVYLVPHSMAKCLNKLYNCIQMKGKSQLAKILEDNYLMYGIL